MLFLSLEVNAGIIIPWKDYSCLLPNPHLIITHDQFPTSTNAI
jgi:hypothetical protein